MSTNTLFKKIKKAPGNLLREIVMKKYRAKLENRDFSLITNNCIGGYIYHDMKLQFLSPTINLCMSDNDFLVFCENLKEYTQLPVKEYPDSGYNHPVGIISGSAGDIMVRFFHYDTFENGVSKWHERCKRINFDNICVVMEGVTCTREILERFDRLEIERKVVLTVGQQEGIASSFPVPEEFYRNNYWKGKIMEYPKLGLHRHFEIFDYVTFLNSGIIQRKVGD